MIQEINKSLLIYLNSLVEYSFVENIVFIFADAPIFFLPIFLTGCWIYYSIKKIDNKKHDLLFIFYGTVIGIIISLLIQQIIHLDRPETAIQNSSRLILEHIPDASFPSDHATVSFAFLFGLIFAGYKKVALYFGFFVILMNLSRVVAGVHWPFDIVAGAIVGLVGSVLSFKYLAKQKLVNKLNGFIINLMKKLKL